MAFYENTIVAKQDLAETELKNIKDKYNEWNHVAVTVDRDNSFIIYVELA